MQGYVFLEHGKSCSVCINLILIGKTTVDGANIRLKAVERFKLTFIAIFGEFLLSECTLQDNFVFSTFHDP